MVQKAVYGSSSRCGIWWCGTSSVKERCSLSYTQQLWHYYTHKKERHPHPYDAICTASDDDIPGIPPMSLCEAHTQDVWLRPAGSVSAGQQLTLHGPQVEERSRTWRNLTLGQSKTVLTPMCAKRRGRNWLEMQWFSENLQYSHQQGKHGL